MKEYRSYLYIIQPNLGATLYSIGILALNGMTIGVSGGKLYFPIVKILSVAVRL